MKRIYIILQILIATSLVSSCDSILNKEPVLQTTESNVFSSADKIKSNLLGIYSDAKGQIALKGAAYTDIRGEDVASLSSNVFECYTVYEMAVGLTTTDNSDTWSKLYTVINESNTFLANLDNAKDVAGSSYSQYVSEAKFLRALSYYYLNTLYAYSYSADSTAKSVPLRLKAESSTADNNLARSTVAEVYTQILSDLSESNIAALPNAGNTYDGITRASQAAARVLKQRVYMEKNDWKDAITQGEAITGYQLLDKVSSIFTNDINKEVIFSFPMSSTNKGGDQTALAYYYHSGNIFILDNTYGYLSKPNYSLSYDTRIKDLVSTANSNRILTKYTDYQTYLDWVPVFRYAEVELNLAESYYNNNQLDKAREALKQVRHRSIAAELDPLDIDNLSSSDLKAAIYNERRAEFVGEGIRSLDIHRRGENFVKRNGTFTPSTNGYIWPIPTSERSVNNLITD